MIEPLAEIMVLGTALGGTTGQQTVGLRFMHGRLQSLWIIRHGNEAREEWRDVPDATPAQAPEGEKGET